MKKYVKEYKGYKVPKGATHYGNSHPVAYFYKFNAVKIPFFYLNHEWKRSSACDVYIKDNLTELPEAPQEWNGEGLPPVGCICSVMHKRQVVECKYIGEGLGDEFIYQIYSGDLQGIIGRCIGRPQFLPLKTQQEKDREAFIECVKQLLPKSDTDDLILSGKLFDLGFTAPKDSDNE